MKVAIGVLLAACLIAAVGFFGWRTLDEHDSTSRPTPKSTTNLQQLTNALNSHDPQVQASVMEPDFRRAYLARHNRRFVLPSDAAVVLDPNTFRSNGLYGTIGGRFTTGGTTPTVTIMLIRRGTTSPWLILGIKGE